MDQRLAEGIESSHHFMVIMSKSYLKDEECLEQFRYAKKLKKPFRIWIIDNSEVPQELLKGIRDLRIFRGNSKQVNEALSYLTEGMRKDGQIKSE